MSLPPTSDPDREHRLQTEAHAGEEGSSTTQPGTAGSEGPAPGAPTAESGADNGPSATGEAASDEARRSYLVSLDVPFRWRAIHIFALVGFALTQPLFAVLGEGPEFFIAHDATATDIYMFVIAVTLLVPLVLLAVEGLVYLLNRTAGTILHLILVGALVVVIIAPPLDRAGASGWIGVVLSLLGGALAVAIYYNVAVARSFLSILGLAPILFAALFLFGSPVSTIAFASGEAGAGGVATGDNPVILVVFDEMSAQVLMTSDLAIDADLFPNFARLGENATWYRNATTVDPVTSYSIPSILTGNRWEGGPRSSVLSNYPENLFVLLGEQYSVKAAETITDLCPDSVCGEQQTESLARRLRSLTSDATAVYLNIITPEDLRHRLPVVTQTWRGFAAGGSLETAGNPWFVDRAQALENWVSSVTAAPATLHFMHSPLPHVPWEYLPSGKTYGQVGLPAGLLADETWGAEDWAIAQGLQRHILQTQYVDRVVGELIDSLEEDGTFDQAMIIITADHGVSFLPEGQRRRITANNYWDILNVPLFVKYPEQEFGEVSDANVESIDILPTIIDVLDVDVPWRFHGHSMLDGTSNPRKTVVTIRPRSDPRVFPPDRPGHLPLLEEKVRLAGGNPKQADIYAIGPNSDLVGHRVAQFELNEDTTFGVVLERPVAEYEPDSQYIPSWVEGTVVSDNGTAQGSDLALAVNGTIQAVARSFSWKGEDNWFGFVLPEEAFARGPNRLEVFSVDRGPAGVSLTGSYARDFALRSAEMEIVASGGQRIEIVEGHARGLVEVAREVGADVLVEGWAIGPISERRPDSILVFKDRRVVFEAIPNAARQDVLDAFGVTDVGGESLLGFSLTIEGLADELDAGGQLRVFAVFGDQATELAYPDDLVWQ